METNKSNEPPVTYTYKFADGSTETVRAGENGLTEEVLAVLRQEDKSWAAQEDYQLKHIDWDFLNAVIYDEKHPDDLADHPFDLFPDPKADIEKILFPEEEEKVDKVEMMLIDIRYALTQLTESQQILVNELYGQCKGISQLAREYNVTHHAIQVRRDRILRRIRKIVAPGIKRFLPAPGGGSDFPL